MTVGGKVEIPGSDNSDCISCHVGALGKMSSKTPKVASCFQFAECRDSFPETSLQNKRIPSEQRNSIRPL